MTRRLAAIVAVDVVGYSRLMAEDETETWAAWMELRSIIDPLFEAGGGRIVKSTGDGVLVEAASVIEATRAAVNVQQAAAEFNSSRREDRRLRMRIGVNVGDVIVDETGDIYGDGVNVAARLETLADPGGICLSDAAYQQVRGRVEADFQDRGEQHVKNIPTAIRVWAISDQLSRRPMWVSRLLANRAAALGMVAVGLVAVGVVFGFLGSSDAPPSSTTSAPGVSGSVTEPTESVVDHLWETVLEDEITSGILHDGLAFLALADGTVKGLSAATGQVLWSFDAGGMAVNLTAAGDRVFFVRSSSKLAFALDGSSGRQVWSSLVPFDAISGVPVLAPLGDDLAVAFGLGVAVLDGDSGDVIWSREPVTRLLATGLSASGSTLVVADGRWVLGLDGADGNLNWELGPPDLPSGAVWLEAQELEIASGLGRSYDRRVLLITSGQELFVLGAVDGAIRWTRPVAGIPGSDAGSIYVAGVDGQLVARDSVDGAELWENDDVSPDLPPLMLEAVVVLADAQDLVSVNPRSGTELGRISLGAPPGQVLGAGDVALVLTGDRVFAVQVGG